MLDAPLERDHIYSVFLSSTSSDTRRKEYPPTSIILGQQRPPQDWLNLLTSSIEAVTGHLPTLASFEEAGLNGRVCIVVAEMSDPILAELGQEGFFALRKCSPLPKGFYG